MKTRQTVGSVTMCSSKQYKYRLLSLLPSFLEVILVLFISAPVKWVVWISAQLLSGEQNQNSSILLYRSSAARNYWFCWYNKVGILRNYCEISYLFFLNYFVYEGSCRSILFPQQNKPPPNHQKNRRKKPSKNQHPWKMEAVIIDMMFTHFGQL